MDVGKGSAKHANHLFKTFAPLLLARKRVEFHEINGHEIVHPPKLTLMDDFLTKLVINALFSAADMGFSPFHRTTGILSIV
jgi:hypothetical protein